ncbi:MAG: 3-oxoacid CoA-transferase subunit A [Bacteroidales bacterium]|nr:3-oxoacid CoA-transferase subunit A [Bacteroidales bacterium]
MAKKITVEQAADMIKDGMTIMVGGFLSVGSAHKILAAISRKEVKNLTIIANDTGYPDRGVGILVVAKQVKKAIVSHIGTNPTTIEQYNNKEIEVVFVPQGTLAERVRCGGAGLGGVLTPTGIGTIVEEGKQKLVVEGKEYLLETPLHADIALIGANICDESGNCVYLGTTRNFNPMMATAANVVIVEAEKMVKTGEIPAEHVHTPALFVDYIVVD